MIARFLVVLLVCVSACGAPGGDQAAPPPPAPAASTAAATPKADTADKSDRTAKTETAAPASEAAKPAGDKPAADKPAADKPAAVAPAQAAPKADAAAAPEDAAQVDEIDAEADIEAALGPNLVNPNAPQPPAIPITDIDKHRQQSLSYVRSFEDRVPLKLEGLNLDADPVLLIDKKPVSRADFQRRALMYAGESEIDRHITYLLTEAEAARQIAAGTDPKKFEVSEADVDQKYNDLKDIVATQAREGAKNTPPAPGDPDPVEVALQAYLESIEGSMGMAAYRKLLAADARFERVFLPMPAAKPKPELPPGTEPPIELPPTVDTPKPDWMPQATWDAMAGNEQDLLMRAFVADWGAKGEDVPALFRSNILAKIRDGLISTVGVKFFFDEVLPPDVLMRVGDRMVKTEEIWPLVKPTLTDADVDLIVRELLMLEGMRAALTASDRWLDDQKFAVQWKAENDKFAGTLFPLKTMIMFRGYTSLDRYREHFRYRDAYYEWRRASLTDQEVQSHYQGGGRLFFERGAIVVDLAYAPLGGKPFNAENLEACRKELADAIAAARATDEGKTPPGQTPAWWKAVAQRFPPPPAREGMDPNAMQRVPLRMAMTEDELSIFLAGYSLADDAFYHGHAGEVFGPVAMECRRHAWGAESNAGAWALYVRDYSRRQTLSPFEGEEKTLAYEDFLDLNYFNWSSECLATLAPKVKVPK